MHTASRRGAVRSALIVAAAIASFGLGAFPAAAPAMLTYVKDPLHPVVYTASGDGSRVKRVGPGSNPRVFGHGLSVAYLHEAPGGMPQLMVSLFGRAPRALMGGWRAPDTSDVTPDGATIAALRGPEVGARDLVLIDVASGNQRVVASGYFSGLSFCPDCPDSAPQLVYAKSARESFPSRSDLYKLSLASGETTRLTDDHRSLDPLWRTGILERGRPAKIVFVKQLGAKRRKYGPKNELFFMNPHGGEVKRLTHTRVGPLALGLFPTEWGAEGRRLLAEFEGQDLSYAVGVEARTGAQHSIGPTGELGFVGSAISSDGETVLGYTGGFDPGARHDVVTVPYKGGRPRIKVRNAFEPDWSR
jgi:hypothetical protein